MSPHVIFRTDASNRIGGGHLVRCLSLADEFASRGWKVTLRTCKETLEVFPALATLGHLCIHSLDEPDLYPDKKMVADLLIVDHYDLDVMYETSARHFVKRILTLDDLANRKHDCDFLVDQSPGRGGEDYKALVPRGAELFIGPEYGLLRSQFRSGRQQALQKGYVIEKAKRILINFGAVDGKQMVSFALRAIAQTELNAHLDIVVKVDAERNQKLKHLCEQTNCSYTFHSDVSDMAALMLQADMAIGAGGTSSLERCCLGLPAIVIATAENQLVQAKALQSAGAHSYVGFWRDLVVEALSKEITSLFGDTVRRSRMKKSAMEICDGRGVHRLVSHIMSVFEIG
jgi:UDP-2,4-diacetamido-2,4,6-trideoxy-beta-L-altropyranose hydrolase